MKKLISIILALTFLALLLALPASAEGIQVTYDGKPIDFDVQPTIINDRTMVPMRAVFEALGATVMWDDDTKTVTAGGYYTTVNITIGSEVMFVNAEPKRLDSPAIITDGRTLVPVRAISEAFGSFVDWDPETKTVIIETENYHALKEVKNKKTDEIEEIEAATVSEFVNAIGSNRRIILTAESYNLSELFEDTYYGFEISDVVNLTIEGNAKILTEMLYTNVISFTNCADITLKGITSGHIKPSEEYECEGSVIFFLNCENVRLQNCSLFGCGASGIETSGVRNLTAENCSIYECTYSSVWLHDSEDITLSECEICNNKTWGATFCVTGSDLSVLNCYVHDNVAYESRDPLFEVADYGGKMSKVYVYKTKFENNSFSNVSPEGAYVILSECAFTNR